jgi:DNA-binding CsgD family transcriptional regulator
MIRLGHQDFAQVAEFLRELYAQTDAAQLPATLLAGLTRLIPCEHLAYNEVNGQTNQLKLVLQPFIPRVFELAPVIETLLPQHPLLNYYRQAPDRRACQFSDFLSLRQFRRTGIYQDFYRHIDTDHQLALFLSEQGAASDICIAINRKRRGFSERDRTLLDVLRPHFIQARANALAFAAARQRTRALADSRALLLPEETDFSPAAPAREAGLTHREAEVLHWLAEGKTNPEIALILQLSPRTVHKHVEHVFRKLEVNSRHAATLKVLDWKQDDSRP